MKERFAVQMILRNGKTLDINVDFKSAAAARKFAADLILSAAGTYTGSTVFEVTSI